MEEKLNIELEKKLETLKKNLRLLGSLGFLIELGFLEECVRMHGNIARIEVPSKDIPRLASEEIRNAVYDELKKLGFLFITLDLKGYKTGSMNATL